MKILILAALEKEISLLNNLIKAETKDDFCCAKINDNDIYTAITGVGILNATIATSTLINKIHPDIIINIGTAGGHILEVKDEDIIVCDRAIYHGGYILDKSRLSECEFMDDTSLIINADEELSNLLDKINIDSFVHHGATLSGDFFTKDVDLIKSLHNKYHHLCEDMETIAIYKVAQKEKIPAIAIRIISNNELLGTKYEDNVLKVNEKLQKMIFKLLNHLD